MNELKELKKIDWGIAFINYLKKENTYSENDFKFYKLNYEISLFKEGFLKGKELKSEDKRR